MNKNNIIRIVAGFVFLWYLLGCTVGNDFEKPQLYSNAQIEQALKLKPQKQEHSYVIFNDPILEKLQSLGHFRLMIILMMASCSDIYSSEQR